MTDIAEITGINKIGLLSLGAYRPERVVTNDEICERIESSDEWIYTRTGIKTRRFAADEKPLRRWPSRPGARRSPMPC